MGYAVEGGLAHPTSVLELTKNEGFGVVTGLRLRIRFRKQMPVCKAKYCIDRADHQISTLHSKPVQNGRVRDVQQRQREDDGSDARHHQERSTPKMWPLRQGGCHAERSCNVVNVEQQRGLRRVIPRLDVNVLRHH